MFSEDISNFTLQTLEKADTQLFGYEKPLPFTDVVEMSDM